jgi:tRNA(Ile)-lysidine synthase TilS/MesJ
LILAKLGYSPVPVAVDMGYERTWAGRIATLARALDLNVEIVPVRHELPAIMPPADYHKVQLRLQVLDSIGSSQTSQTPCTHCYNAKVIALDNVARRRGVAKVAFGHHLTDACSSLLKEAILRLAKFDRGHARYSRSNFESIVDELSVQARGYPATPSPLLERIGELVRVYQVDTDEPPRQPLRTDRPGVDIVRPLFKIWEESLAQLSVDLGIAPEGSGCGHGAARESETPREMVHYRVLKNATPSFRDRVASLVVAGVSDQGYGTRRSRYHRVEDLGPEYKSGSAMDDKL